MKQIEVTILGQSYLLGCPEAVGNMTSGGTESILLATKAAREHFRATHPDAKGPLNIVMPVTGHPAFDKAAILMDVEVRRAPLRPDRVLAALKAAKA